MDPQIVAIIGVFIATIPGILGFIAGIKRDKKEAKAKADALKVEERKVGIDVVKVAQDAAVGMIQQYRDEVSRLNKLVDEVQLDNEAKEARIVELEKDKEAKEKRIVELEGIVVKFHAMETELKEKDMRIAEMESLLREKDTQIAVLQSEINQLQDRVKKVEQRRPTVPRAG